MLGSSSDVPVSPSALRRTRDILERLIIPESGVISSSRELSVLGHDFPQALARYFDPFVGIDSATDHLPLGFVRVEWAPQALLQQDAEIQRCEQFYRSDAVTAARELLDALAHHFGETVM